ncbi:hypothetical protein GIB67_037314 [Kingdonia uniflora]|uniref:H(+)-exporting diphosphatase n=1 Tax=Kingdonia uniflora TaxID=39325 RepID=A0A7J7MS47_9MAGN|nr:hypothetical protein GIB67_037314 [Kingdonia uniflora]
MCKSALANAAFSTVAFVLRAITSIIFGFLGMKIAIYANARTTLEARKGVGKVFITAFRYVIFGFLGMKIATYANARTTLQARKGVGKAFITTFRSGAVMGFLLAANGLLVLYITINVFKLYYGDDWEGLFEAITGYVRYAATSGAITATPILNLSRASNIIMLFAYVAYGRRCCEFLSGFAWLSGMTVVIIVLSEYVVGTIEDASETWGLYVSFIGIILLPIVGNVVEHAGAVIFAFKNKLDISLGVALGSETQISMFVGKVINSQD